MNHRNSIETWSAAAQTLTGSSMNYDFTTVLNQAFGNNTGDVNQDDFIDGTDKSMIDNDILIFATGYLATDLNCGQITDGTMRLMLMTIHTIL